MRTSRKMLFGAFVVLLAGLVISQLNRGDDFSTVAAKLATNAPQKFYRAIAR